MEDNKKVYLDTSVISALFDLRTPERQKLTQIAWLTLKTYDVYISEKVIKELKQTKDPEKTKELLKVVSKFKVLTISKEVEDLTKAYIAEEIFPEKFSADALHVALASVNGIGYVLSWNFNHLVKVKTRKLVSLVNVSNEYPPVEIIAPPEL